MAGLITATLIVRDEQAHIGACLDSAAGIVDEIVVVDTGSHDESRQIAAAHGARVFEHAWRDDFAAARNHALDQASSDWILYIDADERLRPYDRRVLAGELGDAALCACTVRFYPQTGLTAYPEHRLFRHDPRIRFQSAIHETIVPAIDALVATGEYRVGSSGLTIDHLGYDGDQSRKYERNLPMLLRQVVADPDRTYLWWHLGTVYHGLGRIAEAEAAWWQGVSLARTASSRRDEEALCFIELAKLRLSRGEDALPLIQEALAFQPDNSLLQWLEARAWMAAGRYGDAMMVFERLARVNPETLLSTMAYDQRIFGAWALAELGHCAFLLGRYRESSDWYARAEALEPDRLEFRVKRRLALARVGGVTPR